MYKLKSTSLYMDVPTDNNVRFEVWVACSKHPKKNMIFGTTHKKWDPWSNLEKYMEGLDVDL